LIYFTQPVSLKKKLIFFNLFLIKKTTKKKKKKKIAATTAGVRTATNAGVEQRAILCRI